MRTQGRPKLRWCRRCPLCAPSGECRDTSLKSGRCGDWVWYLLRGSKQCRRVWVKPKDPRTHKQRSCRAHLRAASKAFSEFLTDAEQDACIAAGAKVQSRVRAGSSGPLTGHQHWVKGKLKPTKTRASIAQSHFRPSQVPHPPRDTRASLGPHRVPSGTTPAPHRSRTGSESKPAGKRKNVECRKQGASKALPAPQRQRIAQPTGAHRRGAVRAMPGRAAPRASKAWKCASEDWGKATAAIWRGPRRASGRMRRPPTRPVSLR
jgi:hypothetical protein